MGGVRGSGMCMEGGVHGRGACEAGGVPPVDTTRYGQ